MDFQKDVQIRKSTFGDVEKRRGASELSKVPKMSQKKMEKSGEYPKRRRGRGENEEIFQLIFGGRKNWVGLSRKKMGNDKDDFEIDVHLKKFKK